MTTENNDVTFWERNDEEMTLTITRGGSVWDLTGATVEVYIKPTADTPDDEALLLTSDVVGEITITDAPNGVAKVNVSSANNASPGSRFWKADVVDSGGKRKTAGTGSINTKNT